MNFQTTPTGYEKTILSDLHGAWSVFREAMADDNAGMNRKYLEEYAEWFANE